MEIRTSWIALALAGGILIAPAGAQAPSRKFPLSSIAVEGTATPVKAVIAASGLKAGTLADEDDFRAAVARLDQTGLFRSISYRYEPASRGRGYALTFTIADADTRPARIDIPGIDEAAAWKWIQTQFPLITGRAPSTPAGERYYLRAIVAYLASLGRKDEILAKVNETSVTFEPKSLPKIEAVRFTGCVKLDCELLEQTLAPDAIGNDYTEGRVRNLLDRDIRPLYEGEGLLSVKFDKVSLASGTVTTAIEEGEVYRLGTVKITGPDLPLEQMEAVGAFPKGEVANWTLITERVHDSLRPLRRNGYLNAEAKVERRLDAGAQTVDVDIAVTRGPRFRFGRLRLGGLVPALENIAQQKWTLAAGAWMDEEYPEDFVRRVRRDKAFEDLKNISIQIRPTANATVVDVSIDFQ